MGEVVERTVASKDGTIVGFEVDGSGPPMVLVHGGTADRSRWAPVRGALAERFTLHLLDRRGRGLSTQESDDTYDIQHEGEDLLAVLGSIGAPTLVVGHSYGALVAIEAACSPSAAAASIAALLLYEPAAATTGHVPIPETLLGRLDGLLDDDEREEALTLFFREAIGLPDAAIDAMRGTPTWQARLATLHTGVREGSAANAFSLDPDRLAVITVPTRILVGGASPDWLQSAAHQAHRSIAGSELVVLEGEGHMAIDTAPDRFVAEVLALAAAAG